MDDFRNKILTSPAPLHGGQIPASQRWGTTTGSVETLSGTGIGASKFNIATFMVGNSKGNSGFSCTNRNFLKSIRAPESVSLASLTTSHRVQTSWCWYLPAMAIPSILKISRIPCSQPSDVDFRRRALIHSL